VTLSISLVSMGMVLSEWLDGWSHLSPCKSREQKR
jgi:hypothetical protein